MRPLAILLGTLLWCQATTLVAETRLLMAEERGCPYCARWNRDVGDIYPKTAEGKTAPLLRYDIHSETPDVEFAGRVVYTPTFVLVEDGVEVGRIEGYPGEDLFWTLMTTLFANAGIEAVPTEDTTDEDGSGS